MKLLRSTLCGIILFASGCATLLPKPDVRAERTASICLKAKEYVQALQADSSDVEYVLNSNLEACGLAGPSNNIGYVIYDIEGESKATHKYAGHLKRMSLYVFDGKTWALLKDDSLVFIPPLDNILDQSEAPKEKEPVAAPSPVKEYKL